jgi:trimethylamine--corrinoid protein Co-methyltransferase
VQGLLISEETLALDLIHEVRHKGGFLSSEHTMRHFREDWYPKRIDRILDEHQPDPLPTGVQTKIDEIVGHTAT